MTNLCTAKDIVKLMGYTNRTSLYYLLRRNKLPPPLNPTVPVMSEYVWDWETIKKWHEQQPIQQVQKTPKQDGTIGAEIRDSLREAKLPVKALYTYLDISEATFYDLIKGNTKLQPKTAERLVTFLTVFKLNKKAYTAEILMQRFQESYEATHSKGIWFKNVDFALKQVGETQGALARYLGYAGQSVIAKLKDGRLSLKLEKKKLFLMFFSSRGWDYEKNQWIEKPEPAEIVPEEVKTEVDPAKETAEPKQKLFTPDEQELIQKALLEYYGKIDYEAREARAKRDIERAIMLETHRDITMSNIINKINKWFEQ